MCLMSLTSGVISLTVVSLWCGQMGCSSYGVANPETGFDVPETRFRIPEIRFPVGSNACTSSVTDM